VGLVVAARLQGRLLAEARQLVDRIVQLAVRVGDFVPRDEELESIDELGLSRLRLASGESSVGKSMTNVG
jgi:hypothetical protein